MKPYPFSVAGGILAGPRALRVIHAAGVLAFLVVAETIAISEATAKELKSPVWASCSEKFSGSASMASAAKGEPRPGCRKDTMSLDTAFNTCRDQYGMGARTVSRTKMGWECRFDSPTGPMR